MIRVGTGYDVHRLVEGRKLILGGVEIPYEKGLLGHSDADVLLHAIMDALLGAAAMGDIGLHFPDTAKEYEGADSLKLLSIVGGMLKREGYTISNIDATIIAQQPKMRPRSISGSPVKDSAFRRRRSARSREPGTLRPEGLSLCDPGSCTIYLQAIAKVCASWKLYEHSNGFRAKNF